MGCDGTTDADRADYTVSTCRITHRVAALGTPGTGAHGPTVDSNRLIGRSAPNVTPVAHRHHVGSDPSEEEPNPARSTRGCTRAPSIQKPAESAVETTRCRSTRHRTTGTVSRTGGRPIPNAAKPAPSAVVPRIATRLPTRPAADGSEPGAVPRAPAAPASGTTANPTRTSVSPI